MVGKKEQFLQAELLRLIKSRRSIRKYHDVPIEWDKISLVIEAGKAAPSSGNIQNWKFIVVIDHGKRQEIAEACLQQYWMSDAACHIIVVGYPQQAARYYGIRGERLYTIQNCAAAAENMILMAHSLGLGTCWVGAFDEDMLKRILNILPEYRPQLVITMGYPDEEPPEPSEYTMENLLYLNRFKTGVSMIKDINEPAGMYSDKVGRVVGKAYDSLAGAAEKGRERGKTVLDQLHHKGRELQKKMKERLKK